MKLAFFPANKDKSFSIKLRNVIETEPRAEGEQSEVLFVLVLHASTLLLTVDVDEACAQCVLCICDS